MNRHFTVTPSLQQTLTEFGIKKRLGDTVVVPSEYLSIIEHAEQQQGHTTRATDIGVARALYQQRKEKSKNRQPMNRTEKLLIGVIVVLLALLGATIAKGQSNTISLDVMNGGTRVKYFAAGTVRLNCGSGMTCAFDGVNKRVNLSATGTGGVGGSGTINKIPLWNAADSLGDSIITQSGGAISVGGNTSVSGDFKLNNTGNGIYVKEGANATMGVVTFFDDSVTINTTKVTANSRIFLTIQSLDTTMAFGSVLVSSRVPGVSFTIASNIGGITKDVAWMIVEPAP